MNWGTVLLAVATTLAVCHDADMHEDLAAAESRVSSCAKHADAYGIPWTPCPDGSLEDCDVAAKKPEETKPQ